MQKQDAAAAQAAPVENPNSELLRQLDDQMIAMRGRAETAKSLAAHSSTLKQSLLEHAANIERSALSLEEIIHKIRTGRK